MLSSQTRCLHAVAWLLVLSIHGVTAWYQAGQQSLCWSGLAPLSAALCLLTLSSTTLAYVAWIRDPNTLTRVLLGSAGLVHCVSAAAVFRGMGIYEGNVGYGAFLFLVQAAMPAFASLLDTPEPVRPCPVPLSSPSYRDDRR